MLNTLYTIAGGIALAVGALGASDDFDGAQLAQNAFFGPEDEIEAVDEQELTTEVPVVKDLLEWDEIASKAMGMSLTGSDDLTDDEKLEIAVLNEEVPSDDAENLVEVPQNADNSQPEGLSEEEFYCMLEQQFNDAMEVINSKEEIADSEPLVIEAVAENEPKAEPSVQETSNEVLFSQSNESAGGVELQPEDDVNAENALAEALENSVKEEPWVVVHGLPDIPEKDMNILMDQSTKKEQPVETEQVDIENVEVQDIPVLDSALIDVPEVDAPELDLIEAPLFEEAEEAENADVEEANVEEAEEAEEVEDAEAEEANVEEAKEAEEVENADVEEAETDESEADDALIVEPLEDEATDVESDSEALIIPSLEIPPAVLSEEQRAKISEEVDAIANQSEDYDSWIPRQIPVSGTVDDAQPQTKPEDDFIQNFSKQNVKEMILENNGIDLND